ncbi:MAG: hypothetical protein KatS3mg108_2531 [Isosphaeraceae bacterium]|jgi:hypothetical protein|nr:MAG: hypothetical protein KatS3mg108_2531 [Isosphaeraceae bacterium]
MLFAYFGPETVMPLASIVAAIAGAALMFWRNLVYFAKRIIRAATGRRSA